MSNRKVVGTLVLAGVIGAGVILTLNWNYTDTNSPDAPSPSSSASLLAANSEPTPIDKEATQTPAELPSGITFAEYQQAAKWYRDRYAGKLPGREDVWAMAGEIAVAEQRFTTAVACYRAIPTEDATYGMKARLEEGLALIQLQRAVEAERALRAFLDTARVAKSVAAEDVITAFKWLNFILSVEIRQEERRPLLAEMHQIGIADPFDSKQLFFPNLLILNSPTGRARLKQFLANDPQDINLRVAQVRYLTLEGNFDAALEEAEPLFKELPQNAAVAAALGETLFELGDLERLRELLVNVAPYSETEPWALTRLRGELAFDDKRFEEAARFYRAVLVQDPTNAPCQMGLARVLAAQGDSEGQQEALRKSSVLAEIRVNLSSVQADAPVAANELAAKCEAIGLSDAAGIFRQHARTISGSGNRGNTP